MNTIEKFNKIKKEIRYHLIAFLSDKNKFKEKIKITKGLDKLVNESIQYFKKENNLKIVKQLYLVLDDKSGTTNYLIQEGQFEEAIKIAKEYDWNKVAEIALEHIPYCMNNHFLFSHLANEFIEQDDLNNASRLFLKNKQYDEVAKIFKKEGKLNEAITYYIKARDLTKAGEIYEEINEPLKAIRCYLIAKKNPKEDEYISKIAIDNNLTYESEKYFSRNKKKIIIGKTNLDIEFEKYARTIGTSLQKSKDFDLMDVAIKTGRINEAIEIFKEKNEIFYLGCFYEKLEMFDLAARTFLQIDDYYHATDNYIEEDNLELAKKYGEKYLSKVIMNHGDPYKSLTDHIGQKIKNLNILDKEELKTIREIKEKIIK